MTTSLFVEAVLYHYRAGIRTHAHIEAVGRLAPRRAHLNGFDHAFPQVLRLRLRHRPPPHRRIESIPKDTLTHNPMGIPAIKIRREPL